MLGSIIMNGLMIMVWHCQDYYNGFAGFQDFGNRKILTGIKKSCREQCITSRFNKRGPQHSGLAQKRLKDAEGLSFASQSIVGWGY